MAACAAYPVPTVAVAGLNAVVVIESVFDEVLNVAVTVVAAFIVTVHDPVPEHPLPLQPAKVEPEDALADNVTEVPWLYDPVHVLPLQDNPVADTVPLPVPDLETVRVYWLVVASLSEMESLTTVDSPVLFLTLKYTLFVTSPELNVKLGAIEYVCQLAPLKLEDSLAI